MDDFGDLRQRPHRARADPRHEQEVGEVLRAAIGGRREIGVQAANDDVLGPHVVARRHDEMRQERLQRRLGRPCARSLEPDQLTLDSVRPELAEQVDLAAGARRRRARRSG